ncbi:MAG: glycoside hydrolase family 104 protein [Paraprevotella sp.]|nr:glycoside hydrolase family 104 protein [Paraprevotella sp.]
MNQKAQKLWEQYGNNPQVRMFLDLIATGEHSPQNRNRYDVAFGNNKINLDKHPNKMFGSSSASGRYQFVKKTWNALADQLGLKDFGAKSQDVAAIALMQREGALKDIISGDPVSAVKKLAVKQWASLPGHEQMKLNWSDVNKFYADRGIKLSNVPADYVKDARGRYMTAKATAPAAAPQKANEVNGIFAEQLLRDNANALQTMNYAGNEGYQYPTSQTKTLIDAFADILSPTSDAPDTGLELFTNNALAQAEDARNASVTSFISGGKSGPSIMGMPEPLTKEINKIIAGLD